MRRCRFAGFTLIEVLVAIFIVGVLIALLIPAVFSARESARRIQCTNNLKQIGIALHHYHEAAGSFPWGQGPFNWNDWSAQVMILPYLEQANLYNGINFFCNLPIGGPSRPRYAQNFTTQTTRIGAFLCPSDVDRLSDDYGHINYAANAGATTLFFKSNPRDGLFIWAGNRSDLYNTGLFGPGNHPGSFADVLDGLTQTAAFSEKVLGSGSSNELDPRSPTSTLFALDVQVPDGSPGPYYNACKSIDSKSVASPLALPVDSSGSKWWLGNPPHGRYNHVMTPNFHSCAYPFNTYNNPQGAIPPSSRHPGLVNVLLLDGGVRSIRDSLSPSVWWALGSKAGGEIITSDSYE